jgi:hypothetical protein
VQVRRIEVDSETVTGLNPGPAIRSADDKGLSEETTMDMLMAAEMLDDFGLERPDRLAGANRLRPDTQGDVALAGWSPG